MRSRVRVACFTVALAVLAGCAAHHISKGDSAAATGDWKTAEIEYRTALAAKPNEPGLKQKHDNAAVQAMAQSKARAQACMQSRDFGCAVGEADYEVGLNPGDAEAQALRTSARKAYALDDVDKAKAQVGGNPGYALDLLDHAKTMSNDPEVSQAIGATSSAAVNGLVTQANALQAQAGQAQGKAGLDLYDKSIALLDRAARADSRVNTNLQAARAAKDNWANGEYERIARLGDAALANRNWQGAMQQYQYAEQLKAGGRGRGGIAYAQACANGDAAFAQKNYRAAEDAYKAASTMPDDRTHYAAGQIAAVEAAITAEYQRLASLGDQALQHHDWNGAIAQYRSAQNLRAGGPAQAGMDYATACQKGDAGVAAKTWQAAADAYRPAAQSPFDRGDHYAATQIDRLAVKPYLVRVRSVLVKPVRPDGEPWVGPPSVDLQNYIRSMTLPNGTINWHGTSRVPVANIPTIDLVVTGPDGKRYRAPSRQGVNPLFDAGMVFECNAFDDRSLGITVRYAPPNAAAQDMESISIKLQDLVQGKKLPSGQTVLDIQTAVDVANGQREGALSGGLALDTPPPPPAH